MAKQKLVGFAVFFDDGASLCLPMMLDSDCDGAIRCASSRDGVACFGSKAEARKAIRISAIKARLDKEQGKPANDDFLPPCIKSVKIRRLVLVEG